MTNQTTPALASTTPPIAGVVEQVLDSYAIYIIPSVVVFAGIIVALIFRHKVKALVTRIFRCLFPIHAALPTQEQYSGAEVAQTDLAHRPNGVALENANGIPVPCNNGAVQQNGSVLQSRVAVQNGFRYQNGLVQHEGVQNGYHHQNGIIQQGFVNPQQNGAVHQCLVIFQPNGIIHQNEVANQYEIRAMPSHDASVMNTENTERQRLLTEELPLTNQLQARQTPSDTASNTNDVSQSPLDAESNDHTTDSESNNDSPIGSTSRPERNVI